MNKFDIIFDNGGGITLQTDDDFTSYYNTHVNAAADVLQLLNGKDTSSWDGNDPSIRTTFDLQTSESGGYNWLNQDDVKSIIDNPSLIDDINGYAELDFFIHLKGLLY